MILRIVSIFSVVAMIATVGGGVISIRSAETAHIDLLKSEIDNLTDQIKNGKSNAQIYFDRGLKYRELREYENAIADFSTAIEIDPEHILALKFRGLTYAILGDVERSAVDYDKSLELE